MFTGVVDCVCAHSTSHYVETLGFKCWGSAKWLGHEGGVLINRTNTDRQKVRDCQAHSFGHVRTHQTDPHEPRSRLTPDTKYLPFDLGLPNLWNGEKYVSLLCKPPSLWDFCFNSPNVLKQSLSLQWSVCTYVNIVFAYKITQMFAFTISRFWSWGTSTSAHEEKMRRDQSTVHAWMAQGSKPIRCLAFICLLKMLMATE